jgi:hypothetical protein
MGYLLTTSSVLMCPHGGTVTAISSNARARAQGGFVLRPTDTFVVGGCPFMIGPKPSPCVLVRWVVSGLRGKVLGGQVLTDASVGLCLSPENAPQGTALVVVAQPRVKGL